MAGSLLLVVTACATGSSVTPSSGPTGDVASFGTEAVDLTAHGGPGAPRRICLLVADTPDQRHIGLSARRDLDGFDGMLFVFEDESDHRFWMRDTHIPLDLVPVDDEGRVIDVIPMEPCAGGGDCPTYSPRKPYGLALELPQGDLAAWGFEPETSDLEITRSGETCQAETPGREGPEA
ncbi:MAG: DUF192 domain-containing protein [Acidimicrobiia bacterium]|nr:DUF192 domain-containing protein [Acidimicrobiia bacterium]